jgi:hypothetical protein
MAQHQRLSTIARLGQWPQPSRPADLCILSYQEEPPEGLTRNGEHIRIAVAADPVVRQQGSTP